MRDIDHDRRPGYLAAWKAMNKLAQQELDAGTGELKPPKVARGHRLANPAKVQIGPFAARLLRFGRHK